MVHIGEKIKEIFDSKGLSVSEFGRRINMSRENIYGIFRRKTIDTGLLVKISSILEHDFFQYYTPLAKEVQKVKAELELFKEINLILKTNKTKKSK
jgi:transcriptional regulator with XRE-family HTH domain